MSSSASKSTSTLLSGCRETALTCAYPHARDADRITRLQARRIGEHRRILARTEPTGTARKMANSATVKNTITTPKMPTLTRVFQRAVIRASRFAMNYAADRRSARRAPA